MKKCSKCFLVATIFFAFLAQTTLQATGMTKIIKLGAALFLANRYLTIFDNYKIENDLQVARETAEETGIFLIKKIRSIREQRLELKLERERAALQENSENQIAPDLAEETEPPETDGSFSIEPTTEADQSTQTNSTIQENENIPQEQKKPKPPKKHKYRESDPWF